jgi:hypothetical protein
MLVILCVHSSSRVMIANNETKPIYEIKKGELILDADGNLTPVEDVIQCWLKPSWETEYQPSITFEANSLIPEYQRVD